MSRFGKTLFGGSRFIFWSLAPVLALCAAVLPFFVARWTVTGFLVVSLVEALLLLLILGLFNPRRFKWATRCATAIIFCLCLAFAVDEIFNGGKGSEGSGGVASTSKAITALLAIGLPCLRYALLGRVARTVEDEARNGEPEPSHQLDAV